MKSEKELTKALSAPICGTQRQCRWVRVCALEPGENTQHRKFQYIDNGPAGTLSLTLRGATTAAVLSTSRCKAHAAAAKAYGQQGPRS